MNGIAGINLPPGPVIHDYDFRVTYYKQPINKLYEPLITQRILAGEPILAAVRGTPVRTDKAREWRRKLGLSRKDERPEYALLCYSEYDGYDIVDMYLNKHMTLVEIAKVVQCKKTQVRSMLLKMGVKNLREIRMKNPTKAEKQRRLNLINAAKVHGQKIKLHPNKRKYQKWLKRKGAMLIPVYQDFEKGMSMAAACKKHGVLLSHANYNFKRAQKLDNKFLKWGGKYKFTLHITRAQLRFWREAAQKSNNNVLDWVVKHLNAAAEANA